jgi:2'-deoxynucleoside 5'-phosphate N-hydrolase
LYQIKKMAESRRSAKRGRESAKIRRFQEAGMRVYFAGAISGGRENVPTYQHIVSRLKTLGFIVPTEHVADPLVLEREGPLSAGFIYERDVRWILESDAVVAEVSTPSLGVGYEVCCALNHGKPVLCLYREGLAISKMITGNSSPNLTIATYRDMTQLDHALEAFILQRSAMNRTVRNNS